MVLTRSAAMSNPEEFPPLSAVPAPAVAPAAAPAAVLPAAAAPEAAAATLVTHPVAAVSTGLSQHERAVMIDRIVSSVQSRPLPIKFTGSEPSGSISAQRLTVWANAQRRADTFWYTSRVLVETDETLLVPFLFAVTTALFDASALERAERHILDSLDRAVFPPSLPELLTFVQLPYFPSQTVERNLDALLAIVQPAAGSVDSHAATLIRANSALPSVHRLSELTLSRLFLRSLHSDTLRQHLFRFEPPAEDVETHRSRAVTFLTPMSTSAPRPYAATAAAVLVESCEIAPLSATPDTAFVSKGRRWRCRADYDAAKRVWLAKGMTEEESNRRYLNHLCFNCGQAKHSAEGARWGRCPNPFTKNAE